MAEQLYQGMEAGMYIFGLILTVFALLGVLFLLTAVMVVIAGWLHDAVISEQTQTKKQITRSARKRA